MPLSLRETALKTCEWNRTTLDDVIADLQSMRMIACGAVHERSATDAVLRCKFRPNNMSCLDTWTAAHGSKLVQDSVMVRLEKYVQILAEIYANTNSDELRDLVGFRHPNDNVQSIAQQTDLYDEMKKTSSQGFIADGSAAHFHQQLPVLEACAAIEPQQTSLGTTVKRHRDTILSAFLRIKLRA